MGALSLTNVALLGGLGLLAGPLIAHLLQRRARRPIVFPSIAFLQQVAARHAHLHRLRRFLLLALRMLAVAAVVLAFTRPVWIGSALRAGDNSKAPIGVVILLDASLSTGQQLGSGTCFERLKVLTSETVSALRRGVDLADVILVDDAPRAVFPRLTLNTPSLLDELKNAQPTLARADWAAAFSTAARLLESHTGPKRLIVYSDYQATNWSDVIDLKGSQTLVPQGIEVVLAEAPASTDLNIGLASPQCSPPMPVPGQPGEFSVSVFNSSDQEREAAIGLKLRSLDGQELANSEQTVIVPAHSARPAIFPETLPAGRQLIATFRNVRGDLLPADDETALVVGAVQSVPVLVVSDDDPDDPGTAASYLTRALSPHAGLADSPAVDRLAVTHLVPGKLTAAELRNAAVVFIGYVGVLKQATAELLANYVREGGAIVFFAGEGAADRNVALLNEAGQGKLVPWLLVSRHAHSSSETPDRISSGRWQSKWFREFDEQSQLAIREIGFQKTWIPASPAADAEVLLLFSNDQPALGTRRYGRGEFVLANFSPEASTSDLGKHGPFVALVQILAGMLHLSSDRAAEILAGHSIRFQQPLEMAEIAVLDPSGASVPFMRGEGKDGAAAIVQRASLPGVYRLMIDRVATEAVAVHVDPRESDLRAADRKSIQEALSPAGRRDVGETRLAGTAGPINFQGDPLWGGCLVAALVLFATEMALLGWWRR